MDYNSKNPLRSKTIQGIAVAVLPTVVGMLGGNLSADVGAAQLIGNIANVAGFDLGDPSALVNGIISLFGGAVATYGRFKAVKKIKF